MLESGILGMLLRRILMFQWIKNLVRPDAGSLAIAEAKVRALDAHTKFVETHVHSIKARYDNSMYTEENRRQWWMADYMSAKSANNFAVRRTLRMRSRYEVSNNPYLFGTTCDNANDLISTGPSLQLTTSDKRYNRLVEAAWKEWWQEVDGVEKLKTIKVARTVDGEGFDILKTAESMEGPVKLYPVDVEADQVTSVAPKNLGELWVDGLTLDPITERPVSYSVLNHHPGDYYFPDFNPMAVAQVPKSHVIHWFPKFRPGQVRGVPVFTPSLDLFTELRAFRKATLGAAEIAADFAAVLQTNVPGLVNDQYQVWETTPINRKMMTTIPAGFDLKQLVAEHPATSYEMFQEKCLGEALRPLSYPLNLALGTSQKFNFSSSKLDHINYRNSLDVERKDCEKFVVERLFKAWYEEAILEGAIPFYPGKNPRQIPEHEWHWPGYPMLDPAVDSRAESDQLAAGTKTYQQFWAQRGFDWKNIMAQQAAEMDEMDQLGLEFGEPAKKSISETDDTNPSGKPPADPDKSHKKGRYSRALRLMRKFMAAWEEDKHPRADDGKFGEGGGSGDDKGDDSEEKDHSETHDKWQEEEDKHDEKHEAEDEKTEEKRQKEADKIDAKYDKADEDLQKRFDKWQEKKDRIEDKREKESDRLDRKREKEDDNWKKRADKFGDKQDDITDPRSGEDDDIQLERDDEDVIRSHRQSDEEDELQEKHEAEDEAENAKREKFDEEIESKRNEEITEINRLQDEAQEGRDKAEEEGDDELVEGYDRDLEDLDKRETEFDAQEDAQIEKENERRAKYDAEGESERKALEQKHSKENEAVESKRAEEDEKLDEKRKKEDTELAEEEAILDKEKEERDAAREKEDADREAEQKKEDDELAAEEADMDREYKANVEQRKAEVAEWEAKNAREDTERDNERTAKSADRYNKRREKNPEAHEAYYDEKHHQKYGGRKPEKKAESARRKAIVTT